MNGNPRTIVHYGEAVLHHPCRAVESFDAALADLVDDMFASMYAADGVGLAANQIGVDARVFVVDCADADGARTVAHIVNPVLNETRHPRELVVDSEGCLSVPGQSASVARVATATVTGVDVTGSPVSISGTGTLARCLQHETDHLDGIVYVDRLPRKVRKPILAAIGVEPR